MSVVFDDDLDFKKNSILALMHAGGCFKRCKGNCGCNCDECLLICDIKYVTGNNMKSVIDRVKGFLVTVKENCDIFMVNK